MRTVKEILESGSSKNQDGTYTDEMKAALKEAAANQPAFPIRWPDGRVTFVPSTKKEVR